MQTIADNLPQIGGYAAVAVIFYRCMIIALDAHRSAMNDQREDLLNHMKEVCRNHHQPPQPPVIPLLLFLLLLPGCSVPTGGTVAGFEASGPLGRISFQTLTITPANPSPVPVMITSPGVQAAPTSQPSK